jgi:crotonobetainyl-CoA hydratase
MSVDAASGTSDAHSAGPAATLTKRDGVAIITLNRPKALNAVNAELSAIVGAALEDLDSDPSLRVGVITGKGRAFCAGADLKAIVAGESLAAPGHEDWGFAGLTEHYVAKPLIAAVNGFALGGGTEIVLACDLAVMSDQASLGLPEVKRGLFPAAGGLIRLPRQMPFKVAMEAALTGEPIAAAAALRWGLVNRMMPAEQVLLSALELASAICANAPLAVAASKKIMHRAEAAGSDWDADVWAANAEAIRTVFASDDAKEGPRAFGEKRAPRWTGR